jgi:hypothetical protein
MAAARRPARSEPANSQFFLPMAMGRIAFSTGLCRFWNYAALRMPTAVMLTFDELRGGIIRMISSGWHSRWPGEKSNEGAKHRRHICGTADPLR